MVYSQQCIFWCSLRPKVLRVYAHLVHDAFIYVRGERS